MTSRSRQLAFLCLFFVSGACGLIYEIVWSRLLVFVFGGTTFAITTVLGCFMGGLALGSYLAGRFSHKVSRPARLYGLLEIGVGLYCLLIPFLFDLALPMYRVLAAVSGESFFWLTAGRVVVCAIILLIPTAFMGATLPMLCKAFVQRSGELGGVVARLYGINTIGALVGCAGAGFFLLPAIGLSYSILLAAVLNVSAGLVALRLAARPSPPELPKKRQDKRTARAAGRIAPQYFPSISPALLLLLYALSGFAAMAYQVAWTRALILSMGASTYAFSAIVSCFILGIALGSLLAAPWIGRIKASLGFAGVFEVVIGLSALFVVPLFGEMPGLVKRLSVSANPTFGQVLSVEILCVCGLLIVPTLCMGALLPLVCAIYEAARARRDPAESRTADDPRGPTAGRTVGAVYASNTLGTIIGASVAGFVLIPWHLVGMQRTILIASAISVVIGTVFIVSEKSWRRLPVYATTAVIWLVGATVAAVSEPWSKAVMVSGPYLGRSAEVGEVVFYREGIDTTVAVTTTSRNVRCLLVNGKPDASTSLGDMRTQLFLAHIPLLLKPDAADVCVIGLGSGVTTGGILAHPVETVDVVEISSAVVAAAEHFSRANNDALGNPRCRLHRADGRNYLLLREKQYDLIISEPSNPWISGVANLFTSEFFEIARSRLKPGGLHCQWFHAYSMEADNFAAVIQTMATVFRSVQLWQMSLNDYLIVGSDTAITINVENLYLAFQRPVVNMMLSFVMINDPMQFAHYYIADAEHLTSWIERQEPLIDNLPRLEFSAPRHLLAGEPALIGETLCELGGSPTLAGDADSPLNQEFLEAVSQGRKAKEYLAATYRGVGFRERLEYFRQIARHAPHDARMLTEIDRQLKDMRQSASQQAKVSIDNLYAEIAETSPAITWFREAVATVRQEQPWPLGKIVKPISTPGFNSMLQEALALAQAGESEDALAKARHTVARFPTAIPALSLASTLALDLEGPESAIPYLLKAWVLRPVDPDVDFKLARAYCLRGDRDQALTFLEAAIRYGFKDRARVESSELSERLRENARFQQLLASMPHASD